MPLTDIKIKNAETRDRQYKLSDEKGLYALIRKNGNKLWQMKYRYGGKEKTLSFGQYPEVSLKEARDRRDAARKQLRDGIDPGEEKKQKKLAEQKATLHSFETITKEWWDKQRINWTENHAMKVLRRMTLDIFPYLGKEPISEIKALDLLKVLQKVEARGAHDLAKRLRQTSGQVFRYAIATGRAEHDIAHDLRDALTTVKTKNHEHIPIQDFPEFLQRLEAYDGHITTKLAFQFLIHTFTRTSEVREATWDEIDFAKREWRIKAERMKMRVQHIVSLTDATMNILNSQQEISGDNQFIFPSPNKPMQAMSNNTLLYALYRMGYHSRATVHGFRALASTILNENGFRPDVIERQLAHAERNRVRAAYNHAEYLPERKEMMAWWSNYIEEQEKK